MRPDVIIVNPLGTIERHNGVWWSYQDDDRTAPIGPFSTAAQARIALELGTPGVAFLGAP